MTTKTLRKIVKIDEEKCTGCGLCVPRCAEGALQIIDGKARLVSEVYCDGLGACLGECPEGAITIEERAAVEFSEAAVHQHLKGTKKAHEERPATTAQPARKDVPCGCPSSAVAHFARKTEAASVAAPAESTLSNWPVQLALVPPQAPFLKNADILLSAQCVPFAYAGFHEDLLREHALLIACPKLDDFAAHLEKLTAILEQAEPKSLTVARMEVPCCSGLVYMAKKAIEASGKDIPFQEIVIGVRGDRKA